METLRKNSEITQSCMVQLEQLTALYTVEKKKINEEIARKSAASLEACSESSNFPTDFYQELTRLKIEFDRIVSKEKEDTRKLMAEYQSKLSMVSTRDIEKLRIYEQHLSKPVITWDYLSENPYREFPRGNLKEHDATEVVWLINLMKVIQIELGKL